MEETANKNVTTDETAAEPSTEAVNENVDEQKPEQVLTLTIDEYNKRIQSAASKGKNALLNELGIKSVSEFKSLQERYDSTIAKADSDKKKYEDEVETLKMELSLSKSNVDDAYKSDAITLAKSKVNNDVNFETALNEVLNKNPGWRKNAAPIKMGTDKTEAGVSEISASLKAKYPWLK